MKVTREQAIYDIIEHDLDSIFEDHPERAIAEMLECGVKGLNDYTNEELEEQYETIFEKKLTITNTQQGEKGV
jgi:hypothetical protein